MRFFQKSPPPKKPEKNNGEQNGRGIPGVESTASFWSIFSSGVSGLEDSKLPRPYCCHDTWQSSESHHHERCVARISSLRVFSRGYATWRWNHRGMVEFFFFFRGVKEEYTLNKNPKPPQQTSKHLGKRLLSEVFAQNQHRRYPIDISRTRFEPVSSVRTFFTKIRFSLAKNMPPRSGFCSQKERLGTS